jgi:Protein of unknown function (DUF998)
MRDEERSTLICRLAVASIAGQLIFVATIAIAGAVEPGYDPVRDAISALGARDAAHPWVFDTAVAIWGLSFLATAVALWLDAPRSWRGRLGPALLAVTGLAQILDGFPFPADCRKTIDAGCRAREIAGDVSWQHYAHGWTYFVGGIVLLTSIFALAWRFRGDERWAGADRLALGCGIFGVVVFGSLFFATGDGTGGYYGLVQRLSLGAAAVWVGALAVGLLTVYGRLPGTPLLRSADAARR